MYESSRALSGLLGRLALLVARTRPGAVLAWLAVAQGARWLPVQRLALPANVDAVAFDHPAPQIPGHVAIVPRRRLRSICELVAAERDDVFLTLLEAARAVGEGMPPGERVLVVNAGARQEVAQLHAHLLPFEAARQAIEQAVWSAPLGCSRPERLASLQEATRQLGDCAPGTWGMLLARVRPSEDSPMLYVSLGSAGATRHAGGESGGVAGGGG